MTAESNKAVVRRMYEEGWGKGDLSVFDDVLASTQVVHFNDLTPSDQNRSIDMVKKIVRDYRAAFPDLRIRIDDLVAEGDKVVAQVTFVGTHSGTYVGYAPTHKCGSFTDMQIHRLVDGKIAESSLASGGLRFFYALLDGTLFKEQESLLGRV